MTMTHDQATELLASYALDAVSRPEHDQLETHLAECPRCRSELDGYREVAAAMGNSVEPLPEGLWSSIAARLPERPHRHKDAPAMPRLVNSAVSGLSSDPNTEIPVLPPRRQHLQKGPIGTIGAIAVAAAAVATVFGIGLVRSQHQVDSDNSVIARQASALARPTPAHTISALDAALRTKGHKVVTLGNGEAVVASFVVLPDGRGILESSSLATLPNNEVYQLWGIVGQQPISLGLLGASPKQSTFTMAGTTPSRLSVTVEPAGGAVVPSGSVVASGTV
jgi:anti-sigma factor RsiW